MCAKISLEVGPNATAFASPPIADEYPFWVSQFGYAHKGQKSHQIRIKSDVSCLQYVISGSGVIISNKRSFVVNQGDTFLLLEGTDQNYYSISDNPFERIWINFKGVFATEIAKIYNIEDFIVFRNVNTSHLIEEMHKLCEKIDDVNELKKAMSLQYLKIVHFLSENKPKIEENSDVTDFIRHYIDCHITENIKISDVAKFSHFTPEHVIRIFKKNMELLPINI